MREYIVSRPGPHGTERVEAKQADVTANGDLIFGESQKITHAFAKGEWTTFWLQKDA